MPFFVEKVLGVASLRIKISVATLAENPLDLVDFASIWRKIFAFGGQRISVQVLVDFFQNLGFLKIADLPPGGKFYSPRGKFTKL